MCKMGSIFSWISGKPTRKELRDKLNEVSEKYNEILKQNTKLLEEIETLRKRNSFLEAVNKKLKKDLDEYDEQIQMYYKQTERFKNIFTNNIDSD